ncbi:hypothetical protein ACFL5O_12180 [Myxococcota bacterium]
MSPKDEAARELVAHHFAIEPDLRVVYRMVGENEAAPTEPIRLLEVNAATIPTGSVEVFGFGPSREVPFSVEIAEVTPDEFEAFQRDPRALPRGWDLTRAQVFERPKAAE